eukprot:gene8104-16639_t
MESLDTISDLKRSCDDSVNILNQLLLYDKLDSGIQTTDRSLFEFNVFMLEAVRPFYLQAREGDISLSVNPIPEIIQNLNSLYLFADKNKLTIVIRNLLSNALKFTRSSAIRSVSVNIDLIDSKRRRSTFSNTSITASTLLGLAARRGSVLLTNVAKRISHMSNTSGTSIIAPIDGNGNGIGNGYNNHNKNVVTKKLKIQILDTGAGISMVW